METFTQLYDMLPEQCKIYVILFIGLSWLMTHIAAITPWKWDDFMIGRAPIIGNILKIVTKGLTGNYLNAKNKDGMFK
jgi:hypothetical protein